MGWIAYTCLHYRSCLLGLYNVMAKSTYTCFYTNRPFWAIEHPDIDDPEFLRNFTNRMSEIVFAKDVQGISLRIARDGLIELQDRLLEERILSLGEIPPFEEHIQIWSKYLQLANSLFLMLDIYFTRSLIALF